MDKSTYNRCPTIIIRVELPNPDGRCGNVSGVTMKVCDDCCKTLGLINGKQYHDYTYSNGRFRRFIEENKKKILGFIMSKERINDNKK